MGWALLLFCPAIISQPKHFAQKNSSTQINLLGKVETSKTSKSCFYRTRVRSLFTLVTNSLTHWLTHWLLFSKLYWCDLACEDANSKLVDAVIVADDDGVGNNLLQIWNLRFRQKAKLLFRLWAQGLVKIWSWSSGKIWCWSLVSFFLLMFCKGNVESKLNLGRDCEARFGQDFEL